MRALFMAKLDPHTLPQKPKLSLGKSVSNKEVQNWILLEGRGDKHNCTGEWGSTGIILCLMHFQVANDGCMHVLHS